MQFSIGIQIDNSIQFRIDTKLHDLFRAISNGCSSNSDRSIVFILVDVFNGVVGAVDNNCSQVVNDGVQLTDSTPDLAHIRSGLTTECQCSSISKTCLVVELDDGQISDINKRVSVDVEKITDCNISINVNNCVVLIQSQIIVSTIDNIRVVNTTILIAIGICGVSNLSCGHIDSTAGNACADVDVAGSGKKFKFGIGKSKIAAALHCQGIEDIPLSHTVN